MASAMGKRLDGKTIVVTGASSGIGKSTAMEFARTSPKNLKLVLTARRTDKLKEIAEEIKKEVGDGVKVLPFQLDVSKPDQVRSFVSNLPKEFQEIDVLVNNAGLVKGVDKAGDIKEDDIKVMFDTNVTGLINMTQAALEVMKKRGESGQGDIINIGSIAGREPYPGGSIYCASKAAVRSFTDAMRKELIATRIRIAEIDPGQVETEFSLVRFGGDKAKADAVYKGVTALTGEDIAETVVFVAGRPENVVIADMLVFPNHQVRTIILNPRMGADSVARRRQLLCTGDRRKWSDSLLGWHPVPVQEARVEDVVYVQIEYINILRSTGNRHTILHATNLFRWIQQELPCRFSSRQVFRCPLDITKRIDLMNPNVNVIFRHQVEQILGILHKLLPGHNIVEQRRSHQSRILCRQPCDRNRRHGS